MSKQQGLLHQETYKTIKKCLEVVNQEGRDNFTNALRSKQGIIAKIKLFLFLNPNKVFILGLTFFGLMSTVSALIIRNNINVKQILDFSQKKIVNEFNNFCVTYCV